jgi:hypothetical protein
MNQQLLSGPNKELFMVWAQFSYKQKESTRDPLEQQRRRRRRRRREEMLAIQKATRRVHTSLDAPRLTRFTLQAPKNVRKKTPFFSFPFATFLCDIVNSSVIFLRLI